MELIFQDHGRGCHKWYASTPYGEYAFSETQGLYEWRDGNRIHHSGGDQQISSRGSMWTSSGYNRPFVETPYGRGILEAVNKVRMN